MDKAKPEFFNDTFSRLFTKKLSDFKPGSLLTGIQTFNELLQYLVLDYKFNRNAASTSVLLKRFDAVLKAFLEHFSTQPVNEKEKKALTDMLQEVKTNPTITKIRSENVVMNPSKENKKVEEEVKKDSKDSEGEPVGSKSVEASESQGQSTPSANYVKRDYNEFLAMMNQLKDKFDDHKIDDAYEIREKVLQWANEASQEDENKQLFAAKIKENKKLIEETELWYKEVQYILKEMNEDEGYVKDTGPKTYSSKYKALPDGKAILKMEGPLKIPLFNILALMYEAEGFNHWVPFCSDAKLIKPLHRASHVYWLKYGLPPPLTSRECHCFGYGADRFERNGSVLLLSRSIDFNEDFKNHYDITIPKETKYVRMDIDVATEFTPISRDEMIMRQVVLVDVKVKHTPPFILTWISRKTGQHMFETMIKKGRNLKGTMWEQGINNNREFYGWLQNKVDKFLTEHELV